MPGLTEADTIRVLIATDSHVGYNERDPIRGDDSWRSFDEVMVLAKEQDVDMVLLAGDLFHDNKPSRKAMYQVMRSLRRNCLGPKPCELELLSDASENFQGAFNHVNYEDQDINVGIPVFSIHGNHDDPSGEGHLCALDLLQVSGLLNYYGRTPESDNIQIKPVLLQKGRTKLALYGMSNVRDERLFRTFRDKKVKFFRPSVQQKDWFNMIAVHQNHHAYTETGYLPENFLPDFLDLVVWGHEHECLIDPRLNPEMNFHVMQPGSSVATSLCPGESVTKHVAILSVTGREFSVEKHRLKSVRPFVMKEIILNNEKGMQALAKKQDNRTDITRYLMGIVNELIDEAKRDWLEAQKEDDEDSADAEAPLPIVRLRVEYSAPDGGRFECENPQRFSNRFLGKVANVTDVVQFYRKKSAIRKAKAGEAMPDETILSELTIDTIRIEKLVREFLTAQSLTILPQNSFGDAVSQFVDKDDKHAMEQFVNESLADQIKHLMNVDQVDEDVLASAMDQYRSKLEKLFSVGHLKRSKKRKLKPKPDGWNSDFDGEWGDQPGALLLSDASEDQISQSDNEDATPAPAAASRGRGRGRGSRSGTTASRATAASTRKAPAPKKPTTTTASRSKAATSRSRRQSSLESDVISHNDVNGNGNDDDVVMLDDDDDEEEEEEAPARPVRGAARKALVAAPSQKKAPVKRGAAAVATSGRQTKLAFGAGSQSQPQSQAKTNGGGRGSRSGATAKKPQEISEDEISDDDDAFEPPSSLRKFGRR